MPYVVTDQCVQCGVCVAGCPVSAITEGEKQSEIDPSVCIECGTCKDNCAFDAILFEENGESAS